MSGTRHCKRCRIAKRYPHAFPATKRGRSALCRKCHNADARLIAKWHVDGRECAQCGEVRPCPAEISDYVARPSVCSTCQRQTTRDRQAAWCREKRVMDPAWAERMRQAAMRYKRANPTRVRQIERDYRRRVMSDPKRKAQRYESARMAYRLRKEREGRPVRPLSQVAYLTRYGTGYGKAAKLPIAPLRAVVERELIFHSKRELALKTGVPERRFWGFEHSETTTVSLPIADAICRAFDIPLSMLYPEDVA